MKGYKTVKIPSLLAALIDGLVENGEYSSRSEFVKEAIRKELRARGLFKTG